MILRQVQRLEIVVVTLDFRPLFDAVAHRHEDALDALHRDRQRMQMPQRLAPPGKRHVDLLACKLRGKRLFGKRRTLLLQRAFDRRARLIDELPETRPLRGIELSHAALDRRQFALLAEHLDADAVKICERPAASMAATASSRIFAILPSIDEMTSQAAKRQSQRPPLPPAAKVHVAPQAPRGIAPNRSLLLQY